MSESALTQDDLEKRRTELAYEEVSLTKEMLADSTLRDELARDRTQLANERTILSYSRTVLGILGLAVIVYKFVPGDLGIPLSVAMVIVAAAIGFVGVRSFTTIKKKIHD